MPTLIDISADLLAFKSLLDECDDAITPEVEQAIEAWFGELGEARDAKLDNYAALIRDLQLRASARKEEQDRLAKRVQADENTVRRLKDRLKLFMEIQGLQKVETRRYRLSVCSNGGKAPLEVTVRPEQLPEKFQEWEVKANTDALRIALECGDNIPGVRQLERGSHLRIA